MRSNLLLCLVCIFGFVATFLPWLHIPKMDAVVYGYHGDGVVTGLCFTLLFLFALASHFSKKDWILGKVFFAFVSLGWVYRSYTTFNQLEGADDVTINDNPLLSAGLAGNYPGVGITVYGIASGLALLILLYQVANYIRKKNNNSEPILTKVQSGIAIASLLIFTLGYFTITERNTTLSTEELSPRVEESFNGMTGAYKNNQFEEFVSYYHPTFVQSTGGREVTTKFIQETSSALAQEGIVLKEMLFKGITSVAIDKRNIQAVTQQEVTMEKESQTHTELQKLLAISDDRGDSWYFISIHNKTKEEIKKFYPQLNPELTF